jgi:hypothetical protein
LDRSCVHRGSGDNGSKVEDGAEDTAPQALSELPAPTMRRQDRAGEALEVDYAGMTLITDKVALASVRR